MSEGSVVIEPSCIEKQPYHDKERYLGGKLHIEVPYYPYYPMNRIYK